MVARGATACTRRGARPHAARAVTATGGAARIAAGVDGVRWCPRSSKPLWGRVAVLGGFDSHALPPHLAKPTAGWLCHWPGDPGSSLSADQVISWRQFGVNLFEHDSGRRGRTRRNPSEKRTYLLAGHLLNTGPQHQVATSHPSMCWGRASSEHASRPSDAGRRPSAGDRVHDIVVGGTTTRPRGPGSLARLR